MALSERLCKLLEARGLDVELMERLGVNGSERGPDWIEIPYTEFGQVVNHKYRTIAGEKRFSQDAEARKCFWNVDVLLDDTIAEQPLIITEGELDAFSAIQAGFVRTISVPDGAPAEALGAEDGENHSKKYSYVHDAEKLLKDVKEIILATDADAPGVNLLNDLAIRLGRHRCRWVKYPKGCKDLNDALQAYGARGVVESVNRAQWMKLGGLYRMSELPPITARVAYPIGIAELDRHYNIRLGDWAVVTGIPGHGKTSFVNEIMARVAIDYGWTVAVASFEQQPQLDHRRNLRTFFNRKPARFQSAAEIERADRWIDEHFVFIVPEDGEDASLDWLIERAAAAFTRYGAKLLVVDPWNEMDHLRPPDMSLTEYTGFAIKQFRKLAKRYQIHAIVVAHPTKLERSKKDGSLPVPTLYDISDSAHWANKCDIGIVIHRVEQRRSLIRIQKTRFHEEIGVPGDLYAHFLSDQARFEVEIPAADPDGETGPLYSATH